MVVETVRNGNGGNGAGSGDGAGGAEAKRYPQTVDP